MPAAPAVVARAAWALLFGNLAIGAGVLAAPGALNDLVRALQVSVATGGQLVTAAAFVMGLGSPLLAMPAAAFIAERLGWRWAFAAQALLALNTSAIYVGQGLGAGLGGLVIAGAGFGALWPLALGGLLAALALSALLARHEGGAAA